MFMENLQANHNYMPGKELFLGGVGGKENTPLNSFQGDIKYGVGPIISDVMACLSPERTSQLVLSLPTCTCTLAGSR